MARATLRISNLPVNLSEDQLSQLFSQTEQFLSARLVRETPGVALIDYSSLLSAQAVKERYSGWSPFIGSAPIVVELQPAAMKPPGSAAYGLPQQTAGALGALSQSNTSAIARPAGQGTAASSAGTAQPAPQAAQQPTAGATSGLAAALAGLSQNQLSSLAGLLGQAVASQQTVAQQQPQQQQIAQPQQAALQQQQQQQQHAVAPATDTAQAAQPLAMTATTQQLLQHLGMAAVPGLVGAIQQAASTATGGSIRAQQPQQMQQAPAAVASVTALGQQPYSSQQQVQPAQQVQQQATYLPAAQTQAQPAAAMYSQQPSSTMAQQQLQYQAQPVALAPASQPTTQAPRPLPGQQVPGVGQAPAPAGLPYIQQQPPPQQPVVAAYPAPVAGPQQPPATQLPPKAQLPPNATATLYFDGMPKDLTKREAAHIFRPIQGYKELRIVAKPDQSVKLFVDFIDAEAATVAKDLITGYKLDEEDDRAPILLPRYGTPLLNRLGPRDRERDPRDLGPAKAPRGQEDGRGSRHTGFSREPERESGSRAPSDTRWSAPPGAAPMAAAGAGGPPPSHRGSAPGHYPSEVAAAGAGVGAYGSQDPRAGYASAAPGAGPGPMSRATGHQVLGPHDAVVPGPSMAPGYAAAAPGYAGPPVPMQPAAPPQGPHPSTLPPPQPGYPGSQAGYAPAHAPGPLGPMVPAHSHADPRGRGYEYDASSGAAGAYGRHPGPSQDRERMRDGREGGPPRGDRYERDRERPYEHSRDDRRAQDGRAGGGRSSRWS